MWDYAQNRESNQDKQIQLNKVMKTVVDRETNSFILKVILVKQSFSALVPYYSRIQYG